MNLCGSRGTGGIVTFGTSTSLNIFDLEEDEEDNASSGDDDKSMNEEIKLFDNIRDIQYRGLDLDDPDLYKSDSS